MAYIRKTYDEWEVQADYGYGDGWECVYTGENRKDARDRLKEYRENEGGCLRLVCKRVRIGE